MTVRIRDLRAEDRTQWARLWAGYQAFYLTAIPEATSAAVFARFLDPASPTCALVAVDVSAAEDAQAPVIGIAHFIYHESCWTAGPYCYLQDLFVEPLRRAGGVGRALIEGVYERAQARGASRVHWLTQETNRDAMKLYDRIAEKSGFVQYRKIFP